MKAMEMTRFEVQRCVGNTIEVLGIYETKEEMLAAANRFALQYACQSGIINGVSGKPDENGRRKSEKYAECIAPLFPVAVTYSSDCSPGNMSPLLLCWLESGHSSGPACT